MSGKPVIFDLSPPPEEADAIAVMKWMIAVMDRDDKSLMFVASVLAQGIKWGGLTERQAEHIQRVYDRILEAFRRGTLEIQGGGLGIDNEAPANVTHLRARSGA